MSEEKKKMPDRESIRKLSGVFSYIWPYKGRFVVGLALLFVSSGVFMVFPYVSGKLMDLAQGNQNWFINNIGNATLFLLTALFLQSIVSFFRVVLFAQVTENAMANLRTDLYQRLMTLPIGYYDQNRAGDLISRISNDVSILQTAFSTTLAELLRQFVILISGVALIFYLTPSLSIFMLATFPVLVVFAIIFGRFIRKQSNRVQTELGGSNVIVEETIQSIQAVKSFTSELFEIARYKKAMGGVVNTALKVAWYRAAFISFVIFILFGGLVAIMWYGARLVQNGEMTVGDLLQFILYTTFIGASIAGLGDLFAQVQKAVGSSGRILEILQETPEWRTGDEIKGAVLKGSVVFDNIYFSYPTRPEVEVLKGVNLTVGEGQKVALVGHSGAGKSTIAQLLQGFYRPEKGNITIGNTGISNIHLQTLRGHIGTVPQEVILFGGTIAENIRYGKPKATMEEVTEAARKANALDFINRFPEEMQTVVGERGVKLSGGQRQRIAIARAVLKDPGILILDEATSSLDAESEHLVQQALYDLMQGRTTIIIAHRLATIRSVDKICVLEKGEIVEEGSHDELVNRSNGAYRNFIDLQLMRG